MDGLRPVAPNYITVGMMNCRPPKKLPTGLTFINLILCRLYQKARPLETVYLFGTTKLSLVREIFLSELQKFMDESGDEGVVFVSCISFFKHILKISSVYRFRLLRKIRLQTDLYFYPSSSVRNMR